MNCKRERREKERKNGVAVLISSGRHEAIQVLQAPWRLDR